MTFWLCKQDNGQFRMHRGNCGHSPGSPIPPGESSFKVQPHRWLRVDGFEANAEAEQSFVEWFKANDGEVAGCCKKADNA